MCQAFSKCLRNISEINKAGLLVEGHRQWYVRRQNVFYTMWFLNVWGWELLQC